MSASSKRIVRTENGVYMPPAYRLEIAVLAAMLLNISTIYVHARPSLARLAFYLSFPAAAAIYRFLEYRKYGKLGRPLALISGETLTFRSPNGFGKISTYPIVDIREIVIYGRSGQRIFRFKLLDGSSAETRPMWNPALEQAATEFLQQALPGKVTVEEPQTFFEAVRGDGPR